MDHPLHADARMVAHTQMHTCSMQVLMFYCTLGIISERAANHAASTGTLPPGTSLYFMEGGVNSWKAAGYPIVTLPPA